ncbi:P27 family phage terminase small subunit [Robinsoniella peoriensis]|uniref:P27 family phage terminase small subunit n=1 Tax=Robinsoniella peoriensis TaxID=180332 RepID=UPI003633F2D5
MAKRKCEVLVENLKGCTDYEDIRSDLLTQLKMNQTAGKYYLDMIEDYMDLWITKNLLLTDVKSRGVSVRYNNGGGQSGYKKNDSVEQVLKVNTQMLKILDSIGIKPSTSGGGDDDDL